jgi:methionyl-tRNA formyltransferase
MLLQTPCAISMQDTAASLHDKLIPLGQKTLLTVLDNISALTPIKQNNSNTCYAEKLHKEEALIDWHKPADIIERQVRAFNPYPVSFTLLNNERIRIWQAHKVATDTNTTPGTLLDVSNDNIIVACGKEALCLDIIQLAGGKMLSVKSILNAHRDLFKSNMCFTS